MKAWLAGITVITLFCSAAEILTENTKSNKYIKLIISLVLLLAVIKPITGKKVDFEALFDISQIENSLEASQSDANTYFCDELENELSDKICEYAGEIGIECSAEIEFCETEDSITPVKCTIYAEYNSELSEWISNNLGVKEIEWK